MNITTIAPVPQEEPVDSITLSHYANRTSAYEPLYALNQWVCWNYDTNAGGKTTKVPKSPKHNGNASVTNSSTWGSFTAAVNVARGNDWPGVGFVFTADDPFTGIDLDDCLNPDTKEIICPVAAEIVRTVQTRWEISPSGTGLKAIVRGHLDQSIKRKDGAFSPGMDSGLEIYPLERFFTITGDHYPGTPDTLGDAQPELDALQDRYGTVPKGTVFGRATADDIRDALDSKGIACRESAVPGGSVVFRITAESCPTSKTKHHGNWWLTAFPDGRVRYGCHAEGCKPRNRWKHAADLLGLDPTETKSRPAGTISTKQRLQRTYDDLQTTLIRDQNNRGYIVLQSGETLTITGQAFRAKLTKAYLDSHGFMPEESDLNNLLAGLNSLERVMNFPRAETPVCEA